MKVFDRFRRNKARNLTQEEVNANLDVEGNLPTKGACNNPIQSNNTINKQTKPPQRQSPQTNETLTEQKRQTRNETPSWSNYSMKNNSKAEEDNFYDNDGDYNLMVDGNPVYIVKQKRGYLSILFSFAQTGILIAMMIQCGVAPMSINPMIGPYPDALNYWGGKNSYSILNKFEYWRLVSPIFLHAGVFHLICNVAVQLDTGAFWEREWGSFIWLTVYLVSAVWGSIWSVIVIPNSIGVGSSGAVCGLFGAKMAEAFCRMCESKKTEQAKLSHDILCEQFGTVLCSVILILAFSFIPYVDWAAHVGGIVGGFSVGLLLFSCKVKTLRWRIIWFLTGFIMNAVGLSLGIMYMHNEIKNNVADEMKDVCGYYEAYFQNIGQDYKCNCMLQDDV